MTATKTFKVGSSLLVAIKEPCVVTTNANITLAGEQTVNSVAVAAGDRVLVKDQTDPIENGVYEAASSRWRRTADFRGNSRAMNGSLVHVLTAGGGNLFASGLFATGLFATGLFAGGEGVNLYSLEATDPVLIGSSSLAFNLVI